MSRLHNFSAGPAAIPDEVIEQAGLELSDWQQTGSSVMEVSHRGEDFGALAEQSEQDLRELLEIPDDYTVLFMQGGATAQFALIPMNLLDDYPGADYLDTGHWSAKAIDEAKRYCEVNTVARVITDSQGLKMVPDPETWKCDRSAAWLHITPNETIDGIALPELPSGLDVPLIADCSSMILSEPMEVKKYAMIYAGAQKNIGPAGLTLVIIANHLLERKASQVPRVFDYRQVAGSHSMLNTPPTFAWYIASLVFRWLLKRGGLKAQQQRNRRKAARLYQAIDSNDFYHNPIARPCRSLMNIPFSLAVPELNTRFLSESREAGLLNLKGHRAVGGMRASIYNAVSEQAVDALVEFMADFSRRA